MGRQGVGGKEVDEGIVGRLMWEDSRWWMREG